MAAPGSSAMRPRFARQGRCRYAWVAPTGDDVETLVTTISVAPRVLH
jgi:hypothetical protein